MVSQPSLTDLFEGSKGAFPVDMAIAGSGAVIGRDVNGSNARSSSADGGGDVLLFDIGVESVVELSDVLQIDNVGHAGGIGLVIGHVGFEAIERFQGTNDYVP